MERNSIPRGTRGPRYSPPQQNSPPSLQQNSPDDDSMDRLNDLTRLIKLIAGDNDGTASPLILSFEEMKPLTKFDYVNFDEVASLKFNVSSFTNRKTKRSTGVEGTASNVEQDSRFKIWISKGPKQFQSCIDQEMYDSQLSATFLSFLVGFYNSVFTDESKELEKLPDRNDLWHVVLVGLKKNPKKTTSNEYFWTVIAAISFTPLADNKTIFLSWLGTSQEKADSDRWGCSKSDKNANFFNGK
ncbi:MAG: hypothetical protein ORN50_07860, partial [Crocinitomicaceae bacterium]|nr:hypothetical protein [Crocinitomicaceae bacterium]